MKVSNLSRLISIVIFSFFWIIFLTSHHISAIQAASCPPNYICQGGCTSVGQCVGNVKCILLNTGPNRDPIIRPGNLPCGAAIVGDIIPPQGVARYNLSVSQGGGSIGILLFISNVLKFFAVICGLLVFFNILYAGYGYIVGAGKTDVHAKVRERLTWSLLGLLLLVAAYLIAALIGLLIFGNPTFLLNPDLTKYGALAPP